MGHGVGVDGLAGPGGGYGQSPSAAPTPAPTVGLNLAPAAGGASAGKSGAAPADWFAAWTKMKKDLEQTTGTSFAITLDNTDMWVLNGPGADQMRDLLWWNLTVTQKLWTDAKLIVRVRGSTDTHKNLPPHGLYPVVHPKLNLDWRWAETTCIYVANLYLEQKLLDKKLTITIGKINAPLLFDTNNVAGWDFLSHSIARNAAYPHKYHTLGAVVRYDVTDWLYVQAGAIDAQGSRSETGFSTAFHAEDWWQSMYEVGFKTKLAGKEGNWRFELWHDPRACRDGTAMAMRSRRWGSG